jgi:putative CocE/NonD family hydrolase
VTAEPEPLLPTRLERNVRIPMRDGVRLAADLFRPDAPGRFPALVEYIPYRKDDMTVARHGPHLYFAERGYVGVRLDVRGTGASEGVNTDEYPLVEQQDGYDAIEWLAAQPWCDGNVAMFGTSYGGFTALQVALHRPPHLKAIVPMYATDDRYTDDCHYLGGLLRMYYDVGFYATRMVAWNALPPAMDGLEADWARIWEMHLESNRPYMLTWLAQQADGPYWRPASVAGQYERIACPVFVIGGWRDGYPNPPLRLFEHLRVPCRVLIGPWDHARPDAATPGPRIDFLHEMRRWLDHWLKGRNTGVMSEPPIAVYMQRYDPPDPRRRLTTGAWRWVSGWPPDPRRERTWFLAEAGALTETPPAGERVIEQACDPTVGLAGGLWSGGLPVGLPGDQRPDEAFSLVFTSAPLPAAVEVLGRPRVVLRAGASAEIAAFVLKLADVAPDGGSALVTRGALNGTRRRSLTAPTPMVPGELAEIVVDLDATGWIFEPGHRIRLALAGADFPNIWPTPLPVAHRVSLGGEPPSRLVLPLAPPEPARGAPPAFLPPPPPRRLAEEEAPPPTWEVRADTLRDTRTVHIEYARRMRFPDGGEVAESRTMDSTVARDDPAHARASGETRARRVDHGVATESVAHGLVSSTRDAFHFLVDLEVRVAGRLHFQRRWTASFPRLLL